MLLKMLLMWIFMFWYYVISHKMYSNKLQTYMLASLLINEYSTCDVHLISTLETCNVLQVSAVFARGRRNIEV